VTQILHATHIPRRGEASGWSALLPPPPDPQRLDAEHRCDIAIIGAGFTGVAAAERLLQIDPSLSIALLDATTLDYTPAARGHGVLSPLPPFRQNANRDQLHEAARIRRYAIDFMMEKSPASDADTGPVFLQNAEVSPHEHSALGLVSDPSGSLEIINAAQIAPPRNLRDRIAALAPMLTFFENSPVLKLTRHGHSWGLMTPVSHLTAQSVILATGGFTEGFGLFRHRLIHAISYLSLSTPIPKGQAWAAITPRAFGPVIRHISGEDSDRILIQSVARYTPTLRTNKAALKHAKSQHLKVLRRHTPVESALAIAQTWSRPICVSRGFRMAHVHAAPHLYAAAGHASPDAVSSTLSGIILAERLLSQDTVLTRSFGEPPLPPKLPPAPFGRLIAAAHLRR
jgi:glycine/D-amino acid oxidase-like deaminating enzyme